MRVDLNDAILASGETTNAKMALLAIASHMNKDGDTAWPSQHTLSAMTSLHRVTIVKVLQDLMARGVIARKRRFSASSIYSINVHLLLSATNSPRLQVADGYKSPTATSSAPLQVAQDNIICSPQLHPFVAHGYTNRPDEPSIQPSIGTFVPPTLEEVSQQCARKGYKIDPQEFLGKQAARGWKMASGKPIKSWQGALATWNKHAKPKRTEPQDEAESLLDEFPLSCRGTRAACVAAMRAAVSQFEMAGLRGALANIQLSGMTPWANELITTLDGPEGGDTCPHPPNSAAWMDWHVAKAGRL
jgi:hypothetical protein